MGALHTYRKRKKKYTMKLKIPKICINVSDVPFSNIKKFCLDQGPLDLQSNALPTELD